MLRLSICKHIFVYCLLLVFTGTHFQSIGQWNKNQLPKDEIVLQDAFFSLDTFWIPGKPQRYTMHPYNNYLWIDKGWATISTNERATVYARGTIRGVKIEDDEEGYRSTYFYIAADQISVQLTELPNNLFKIHIYSPLSDLDVMFIAKYVDPKNVEELDMYFH